MAKIALETRKIGFHHFSFLRGVLEGLGVKEMAVRYLETGDDVIEARATFSWINDALVQAARRRNFHSAIRILRLPADILLSSGSGAGNDSTPSLEEFREDYDPQGFYSESELIELFQTHHAPSDDDVRKARLRKRRIAAIGMLEQWVAEHPSSTDPVHAWLAPSLADKLEQAGLMTLKQLSDFIQQHGRRWWSRVDGVGETRARNLENWLTSHKDRLQLAMVVFGASYAEHAEGMRDKRPMTCISEGLAPLEYLLVPDELTGLHGSNRSLVPHGLGPDVNDDRDAVMAWIYTRLQNPGTIRNYRCHVERFMLWALYELRKPLSSTTSIDCAAYREFLVSLGQKEDEWTWRAPREAWIGTRRAERWSDEWRPFSGGLKPSTIKLSLVVLKGFFEYLFRNKYLHINPWDGVAIALTRTGRIKVEHSLSNDQWVAVVDACDAYKDPHVRARVEFILWFALGTGFRLFELAGAKFGDIGRSPDPQNPHFVIHVVGKGRTEAYIPIADFVLQKLNEYIRVRSDYENWTECPDDWYLIDSLDAKGSGLGRYRLYEILKHHFMRASNNTEDLFDKDALSSASTHWLRHTCGTHLIKSGADLPMVQSILRHADISTSGQYLHADKSARATALNKMLGSFAGST